MQTTARFDLMRQSLCGLFLGLIAWRIAVYRNAIYRNAARTIAALAIAAWSTASAQTQSVAAASSGQSVPPAGSSSADPLFPKRKAGLWEIKIAASQQAGLPPTQLCVGENTDNSQIQLDRKPSTKGACKTGAFQRVGNGWLIESVCKEGKFNVTSRSLASGDFELEYRIDTFVSYAPPLASGKREDKDALVAQWVGECKAGQKVGDMFVPGMGYLNMIDGSVKPIVQPKQKKAR